MANSEDPDEMLHYAAFHQSLHCLLKTKSISSKKEIQYFFNFQYTRVGNFINRAVIQSAVGSVYGG